MLVSVRDSIAEKTKTMGRTDFEHFQTYMDVSKNRGKKPQNGWFTMENPIKMG